MSGGHHLITYSPLNQQVPGRYMPFFCLLYHRCCMIQGADAIYEHHPHRIQPAEPGAADRYMTSLLPLGCDSNTST